VVPAAVSGFRLFDRTLGRRPQPGGLLLVERRQVLGPFDDRGDRDHLDQRRRGDGAGERDRDGRRPRAGRAAATEGAAIAAAMAAVRIIGPIGIE
jgi:hypothetical protein